MTLLTRCRCSIGFWMVLVFWTWNPLNVREARQEWTCSSVVLPGILLFFVFNSNRKLMTRLRHFSNFGVQESRSDALKAACKCFSRQLDVQKLIVLTSWFLDGFCDFQSLCQVLNIMQNSWIWRLCTQQLAGRCCVGWSFHSFLADGVLVHGPGGRPWAAQGGIDLPRWCLQLRTFNTERWEIEWIGSWQKHATLSASKWFWKGYTNTKPQHIFP